MPRPSTFDQQTFDLICQRMAAGESRPVEIYGLLHLVTGELRYLGKAHVEWAAL
jgi:hypothetical protein